MNNTEAIINFLYWTHNFQDLQETFDTAFNKHLSGHFKEKLKGYTDGSQFVSSEAMIKLLMAMGDENKESLINAAMEQYNHRLA